MKTDFQKTTPEAAGIPSTAVAAFIDRLEDKTLPMHSILVLKGDQIAAEAYWKPFDESFRHRMYSTSKSFVSVAIGILAGDGKLSLDDRVVDFFPEYKEKCAPVHPYTAMVTVRDLLRMTTCFTASNYPRFDDWTEAFFRITPGHIPGKSFRYDTLGTVMLCMIVRRVAGVEFVAFLQERLFDPVGMSAGIQCIQSPCGHDWGGSGVLCTTRDLAKFAYVCMHDGRWHGEQLIPEAYIRDATSSQVDNTLSVCAPENQYGYGYQFWRTRFGFACRGMGSQLAVCVPDSDLILVTTADTQAIANGDGIIYDALDRFILANMRDAPLAEDPGAQAALQAKIAELSLRTVAGATHSPLARKVNGKTYVLDENSMKITYVRFTFEGDEGTLAYENATGAHEIRFGFGKHVRQRFPETHYFGRTMMHPGNQGYDCHASAAWRRNDSLVLCVYATDEYFGTLRMNVVFDGNTVTLQSEKFAEMFFDEYQGFTSGKANA
ncbi:MAG: serine hydrolase [Lentisphaerae bacterium]|jgi:CubicO group peptidase (beta-lactamase class C family)|nr:serine hydrolase [Lentisphaerota bacterium]MBT7054706.1 serine hydrolase [Lentisphaerota bacterium]MBT7841964.1 serine hydrolase [Lentisphaerota bacterium]